MTATVRQWRDMRRWRLGIGAPKGLVCRVGRAAVGLGPMSELGQIQKSARANAMSAFPPLATRQRTSLEVRFVPTAEMRGEAKRLANLLIRQHAKEANAGD
jgi:hypothetical protein